MILVFFKLIQMRLDQVSLGIHSSIHLTQIKRLFNELDITCPFLPKNQVKRLLMLKGEFIVYKIKCSIEDNNCNSENIGNLIIEQVDLLVECKKKKININTLIGPKILELFRNSNVNFEVGKEFESLIPECEDFNDFHVDLLNILTETVLNSAIECKRSQKRFSELITDAINYNVRSLSLRPNVTGYFEFLKLSRLQSTGKASEDFEEAIKTCLFTLKNRINPNEDIKGKLQIIRLIINETENLEKAIKISHEMFINCDFNNCGCLIMEELLEACESSGSKDNNLLYDNLTLLLSVFVDQLRTSNTAQICVLETLLRLAEKNSTVKGDFESAEEIFKVFQNLNAQVYSENLKFKIIKCYLRLDKLKEAKIELDLINDENLNILLLKLEVALRSQNEFDTLNYIERILANPERRSDHFLSLFNLLKTRIPSELKMKLLQAAKISGGSNEFLIDILRGIIALLYDGILEIGLTEEFKAELENCLLQRK